MTVSANDDTISLTNAPSIPDTMRKGGVVTIRGTVSCEGSNLTSVTAGVYNTSGQFITGKTVNPGAKSYDLKKLDNDIAFNKLTDGEYVFAVIASNAHWTNTTLMSKKFVVGTGGTEAVPDSGRDYVSISGETQIPASLKKGQAVTVKGVVTSDQGNLTSVSVDIYDSNGTHMTGGTANVNAKTYDIRGLDNSVAFNKLKDGNYTFKITAKTGTVNYDLSVQKFAVGSGNATLSSDDPLTITGNSSVPDSLGAGKSVTITGKVSSAKSNLSALTCGVFDSNNKLVTGKTVNPRTKSYDLSTLDYALEFNKLTAGTYTYCVIASNDANSNYTLVSKQFTVSGTASSANNNSTTDKLSISGATNMPSSIKKGGAVNVIGTVTSAESKMTALTVGVYDSSGNLRTGKTINPGAKSFDLSKLDSSVAFHKLPEGTYTFAVIASNASCTNCALLSKQFTVGAGGNSSSSSDKITISGGTSIPSTMKPGAIVNITGTVSSGSTMTSLTCGVYNSSGKFVTGRTINPKSKTYDLRKFDSYVAFHKLPAGTYTYAVIASNGSNTNSTVTAKKFTIQ